MNVQEQLAAAKAKLGEKQQSMQDVMKKAADEGRTLDAAEAEAYDGHEQEVGDLKKHIARLEALEKSMAATAKPVQGQTEKQATESRAPLVVKNTQKLEPGMGFARVARVKALSHMDHADPIQIAKSLYPDDQDLHTALVNKAAVPAANTASATWAGNLILDGGAYFADFVAHLRARTVLGQIESRLRRLPFDTQVLVQGSAGVAKWTGEGQSKPLTQWTYTKTKLEPLKVAAIAAATKETLRRASVAADALIRDELTLAIGTTLDSTLVGTAAAVSGVSPAGLRNGVTALTLPGDGSIDGIRLDIAHFLKQLVGSNLTVNGAFWIMPETVAIDLSMMTNVAGGQAFPGITPSGGTLAGLPVFTSQTVPANVVMLVKGDEIFLGDEGGIEVSISDQASLVMDDAPAQNSTTGTPGSTNLVSLWQTNSVGFLVERIVNFTKRRTAALVWATVDWTGIPPETP